MSRSKRKHQIRSLMEKTGKRARGAANILNREEAVRRSPKPSEEEQFLAKYRQAFVDRYDAASAEMATPTVDLETARVAIAAARDAFDELREVATALEQSIDDATVAAHEATFKRWELKLAQIMNDRAVAKLTFANSAVVMAANSAAVLAAGGGLAGRVGRQFEEPRHAVMRIAEVGKIGSAAEATMAFKKIGEVGKIGSAAEATMAFKKIGEVGKIGSAAEMATLALKKAEAAVKVGSLADTVTKAFKQQQEAFKYVSLADEVSKAFKQQQEALKAISKTNEALKLTSLADKVSKGLKKQQEALKAISKTNEALKLTSLADKVSKGLKKQQETLQAFSKGINQQQEAPAENALESVNAVENALGT